MKQFKHLISVAQSVWIDDRQVVAVVTYSNGYTHFYLRDCAEKYIAAITETLRPEIKTRFGIA